MSRPMVPVRNLSKWDVSDDNRVRYATTSGMAGIGLAAPADVSAPVVCDATQVALIDEIHLSGLTADGTTDLIINVHVNSRTNGIHGATSTRAADVLPFHFPGDTGLIRNDSYTLRPRGKLVVHPSSTLKFSASVAVATNAHVRWRLKSLTAAIRDGDISPNGTIPAAASTNSLISGGTGASTSKPIAYCGSTLVSGTSDAGGDATHMVDAARTEANDTWNGKKIRFTSGGNIGLIRTITDFDAATDTTTFAPAVPVAVGAGQDYEFLDVDEAIEILCLYLTGHNNNAGVTDDIRLGFWTYGGGSFPAGGNMVFRGFTRGLNSRYGCRLLLDNVNGCIQGAMGADLWIEASAGLAGGTPKADYVVIYRKVRASTVSNATGATSQTPVSRGKWWVYTEADPGAGDYVHFFDPTFAGAAGFTTARIKAFAGSAVTTNGVFPAILAIGVNEIANAFTDPVFVNGLVGAGTSSNTWGRDGFTQDCALPAKPAFNSIDAATVVTNICRLSYGTFGSSVVSTTVHGSIA